VTHLLVANDFPPKVGGIQTYLWELWRRFPPEEFSVLTLRHRGAAEWDSRQPFSVHRVGERVLLPTHALADHIDKVAAANGSSLVVLDPALPLGMIGRSLRLPYAVVVHGAEVTVPGRLPLSRPRLARVLRDAVGIIAAGRYPAAEVRRLLTRTDADPEIVEVPPGVDVSRFRPLSDAQRVAARRRLGLPETGPLIMFASRLVPRKGVDVLLAALPLLGAHRGDVTLAVAGSGRDTGRLHAVARRRGVTRQVRFMGRVPDDDLADLFGCGDVFAMLCRNRWVGLEQEGFGIVFLEAAACGVPQIAGDSGGAAEAVADNETGFVISDPKDPTAVAAALGRLLDDDATRRRMAVAARARAEALFAWDDLAANALDALRRWSA
jgi:phosphatidylinositol alpha-1,6-mannosyltransferase